MKYKKLALPLAMATGALIFLASRAEKTAAQSTIPTPAERLPTPSRALLAEITATGTTPAAFPPRSASPPFSSHDFTKPLPNSESGGREVAILAGGCFWCLEAVYELLPGVLDVVSGYTGGRTPRPSYASVSSEITGQAEAVRIVYDPAVVSYKKILDLFWKIHDPTTPNRQGADQGTQYRSAIYWTTEEQRKEAAFAVEEQKSVWRDPIVTELKPAGNFWIAEEYHQDYYRKNPERGYCQVVISPKVEKSGLKK